MAFSRLLPLIPLVVLLAAVAGQQLHHLSTAAAPAPGANLSRPLLAADPLAGGLFAAAAAAATNCSNWAAAAPRATCREDLPPAAREHEALVLSLCEEAERVRRWLESIASGATAADVTDPLLGSDPSSAGLFAAAATDVSGSFAAAPPPTCAKLLPHAAPADDNACAPRGALTDHDDDTEAEYDEAESDEDDVETDAEAESDEDDAETDAEAEHDEDGSDSEAESEAEQDDDESHGGGGDEAVVHAFCNLAEQLKLALGSADWVAT